VVGGVVREKGVVACDPLEAASPLEAVDHETLGGLVVEVCFVVDHGREEDAAADGPWDL
jgi:hypothetical protein